jgi:acetyl-CoA acetyltransferase
VAATVRAWPGRDRCAIVGVGATEFSKDAGRSELRLAAEASTAALADAGLTGADVDGIVRCDMDNVSHTALAETLGVRNLTYWGVTGPGGSAPCAQIAHAVGAVVSGQAEVVLCPRTLTWHSGGGLGGVLRGGSRNGGVGGHGTYEEFFVPYGLVLPVSTYAMIARRHMLDFGTTREHLGAIALTCRERANANPAAQMHDRKLDMDTYLAGRPISTPLGLYDCCLVTDGACAVVVTSAERARDLRSDPVSIRAVALGSGPGVQGGAFSSTLMRESFTTWPCRWIAEDLWRRAGLGPDDVDVAQVYDCFTITVLVQLEDYGFCTKGEGGPFAASGAIGLTGDVPVNTAGGNLSEGYIHGMNHVVEGVRQLRGQSTSPVPGAEVCLVTSGPPPATSAMVLTKAAR